MNEGSSAIIDDERFAGLWDDPCQAERAVKCCQRRNGQEAIAATIQWLDGRKAVNHMLVRRVDLRTLDEWCLDEHRFLSHCDRRFFSVIGLEVTSCNREVAAWSQPIISNPESGVIGLLVREDDGCRSFLLQAKAEVGNRSVVQLGPTVQFTPGNYSGNDKLAKPFLVEEFSAPEEFSLLRESRQAEEGARFYREDHLHRILLLPAGRELDLPDDFRWVTEDEIRFFLHLGEYVNSCCRSILACLL